MRRAVLDESLFSGRIASGGKQAAEKGLNCRENGPKRIPQGLKPIDFIGFIGTTEVVPCYKASADGVLPQPKRSCPFKTAETIGIG
jgi:hypothetical protein